MTNLLLKPEDTGDIPTGVVEKTVRLVGDRTQNLAPYVNGLAPALRRPTAVLELIVEARNCRTVVPNGEDFGKGPANPPTLPPTPDPLPPPPPPTPSGVLWEAEPVPAYAGRHRRPSRWDWLTTPLSAAVQIIRAAL